MKNLPGPAIPMTQLAEPRTLGGNAAFHNFHNDYSHINDPNLRRRLALAEIDKASTISLRDQHIFLTNKVPFGWYHVRAVGVAGIGFFTDSYSLFAINLVTSTLGMVSFFILNRCCRPCTYNII
jgi:MFS transporter, PHS family, inorganic phosphate transporter